MRQDAIGAGELAPGASAAQQPQQRLEAGRHYALFSLDIAQVSKHDVDRQPGKRGVDLWKLIHMHQELDMPTEWLDLLAEPRDALEGKLSLALAHIHNVQSCATTPRLMHGFKLARRRIATDNSHAAERRTSGVHGGQHAGFVRTAKTSRDPHRRTS